MHPPPTNDTLLARGKVALVGDPYHWHFICTGSESSTLSGRPCMYLWMNESAQTARAADEARSDSEAIWRWAMRAELASEKVGL